MKVIIASDHAGFAYKGLLIEDIRNAGHEVTDLGSYDKNPADDYPDYAADVAMAMLRKEGERGIIICGSGIGVSVAANKFKGIRAGCCTDNYSAHQCVEHDDVNVLCIGQRVIGIEVAREIVFTFLGAAFGNAPRHVRRVQKILAIENQNMEDTKL